MSSPSSPVSPSPPPTVGSPGLSSRAASIFISPKHLPSPSPSNLSIPPDTLNSLANAAPSAEKLTKIEVLAPKEADQLNSFKKTLASDISQDAAIDLLQRVDEKTSLFREFSFHDIVYLAQVLTILKFQPGDVIIEAGEESSFVGIALSGELEVRFGDVTKPIPSGSLLGELSFFDGGTRTAAVSASSEAIVGMITFNELELLAEYAPTIRLKLMVLFALEGVRKMRLVNANASVAPAAAPAATPRSTTSDALTPTSRTADPTTPRKVSKRSSMAPPLTEKAVSVEPRSRSLKRIASLARDAFNLAPGALNDKPAAAASVVAPAPATSRTVEALFRHRMQHEQRSQQEKIARALEKRKKAEHRARNTTVQADAYKRDLDKKQELLEELTQENADLREYKVWAQKKHISDAQFLREKLEAHAASQSALSIENTRRTAAEALIEELHAQMEARVTARTRSYVESIEELQRDARTASEKMAALEARTKELESSLRDANLATTASDVRAATAESLVEQTRVEAVREAEHAAGEHARALAASFDDAALARREREEIAESHRLLGVWRDDALERAAQREMLHARLHRHMLDSVDRQAAVTADLHAFKTILKYVLAGVFVKGFRRRRFLRALTTEYADLARSLAEEVAQHRTRTTKGLATATNIRTAVTATDATSIEDMGDQGTANSSLLSHLTLFSSSGRDGGNGPSRRSFAASSGARQDQLLVRLAELVPQLRASLEDLAAQKAEWAATADSFFRRTIALKQHLMDAEVATGLRLMPQNGAIGTGGVGVGLSAGPAGVGGEDIGLSLATSRVAPAWHLVGSPEFHTGLEAANTVRRAVPSGRLATPPSHGHGHVAETKEDSTVGNFSGGHTAARAVRANVRQASPERDRHTDDEEDYLRAPRGGSSQRDHSPGGGVGSGSESRAATRERLAYYRRRCKEYRETNAMLSTRATTLASRLAELEEWQRSLYAHSGAATAAGLVGPFQTTTTPLAPPPTHLPPITIATGLAGAAPAQPPSHHARGDSFLYASADAFAGSGAPPSTSSSPLTHRRDGAPVFHIKSASRSGPAAPPAVAPPTYGVAPAATASPLTLTYPSPNGVTLVLKKRSSGVIGGGSDTPSTNYVIQQLGASNHTLYTLGGGGGAATTPREPPPPANTATNYHTPMQPQPPNTTPAPTSTATNRHAYSSAVPPSPAMLVFPSPPHASMPMSPATARTPHAAISYTRR